MYILTLSCPDQPGIVASVSKCLFENGCNIEEAAQFHEEQDNHFFMRIIFSGDRDAFEVCFTQIAAQFDMDWQIYSGDEALKTLILVSKWDHCLHDLLYRAQAEHLNIGVTAVASNHEVTCDMVERYDIPFHYLPIKNKDDKDAQEQQIKDLIEQSGAELIILARYMQILSGEFCENYAARAINIHHSFLPGFKGARPYHQAHARGVKMIGATAHFVTSDLDEGPIIAQYTRQVDHTHTADKMQMLGRDIERQTLAEAVKLYSERRIFLHNGRTVIL